MGLSVKSVHKRLRTGRYVKKGSKEKACGECCRLFTGCKKGNGHVKYTCSKWEKRWRSDMYVIVGLGNPGSKYEKTRHNVGFQVLDCLAEEYRIGINQRKHRALCGAGMIEGSKVLLVKPQTYMNLSGECVREVVDFYKIDPQEELLVIYDDISLEPGQLRIRKKGSAGGHNGIKNILLHLGSEVFPRIKIGVGAKPEGYDLADYVLGHFSGEERDTMQKAYEQAAKAAAAILTEGPDKAMNLFNQKQ